MLRISNYYHLSDDDDALPCGRTIFHANVCMIRTDSDNEDTTENEPFEYVANSPVVVSNETYQSCVDALINDACMSSTYSPTDNNEGYGSGFKCTPRLRRYIHNPNPLYMSSRVLNANRILNYANLLH